MTALTPTTRTTPAIATSYSESTIIDYIDGVEYRYCTDPYIHDVHDTIVDAWFSRESYDEACEDI